MPLASYVERGDQDDSREKKNQKDGAFTAHA